MSQKKVFDFFQDHSENYLKMAFDLSRQQRLQHPDGQGRSGSDCGDLVEVFLVLDNARIQSVYLHVEGCFNTYACANTVAYLAEGLAVADAWRISADQVLAFLETLGEQKRHCAEMAVAALRNALRDGGAKQQAPWKKIYQRKRMD